MEYRAGMDSSASNAEQPTSEVARTADAIRDMARQTSEVVAETSREIVDNASGIADELVEQMRKAAESVLEEQKGRAADAVARLAEFMHRTSRNFEGESPPVAQLAEHAAGRAEVWARQLRQRGWDELMADTEEFAQRRPMLYLAGTVTAGFVLARLLASSRGRSGATASSSETSSAYMAADRTRSDPASSETGEVGTSSVAATPDAGMPEGTMEGHQETVR